MKMSEFTEYSFNSYSYSLSLIAHSLFFTGLIMLILSYSGTAAAIGGPKATVEQLNAEIAARRAADDVLQDNINNISLTPGPQGIAGNDGVDGADGAPGPAGAIGAVGPQGVAGINGTNGVDGTDGVGPIVDTRSPDIDDDMNDGISVGTLWVDTTGGAAYIMTDNAPGSAVWKLITIAPAPFVCSQGKLQQFSLIWEGDGPISIDSVNMGTTDAGGTVNIGDSVNFFGPYGSNDVVINVSGANIGQSTFHVSCSDDDFNSDDDCNKLNGNGKNNDSRFLNLWRLQGLVAGNGDVLDCKK